MAVAQTNRPYPERQAPVELACRVCGSAFTRPAWRVRQAAKQGATLHCSYACAHAARRTRTPESVAEYHRDYRERYRERIRQNQKTERHGEKRDHVLARDRAIYRRNVEINRQRAREYAAKHPDEARARRKAWPEKNPERANFHIVRNNIAQSTGMRARDVPEYLVDARIEYLKLRRCILAASAMSAFGQDPAEGLEAKPASATRKAGDAQ